MSLFSGYVGYEEGGTLTEAVRRRPYQLLLLDEFEKGHKDVWNLLLQLFDDGVLTDSHGRKVDFRNVIVVMTSNIGADIVADMPSEMQGNEPEVKSAIMNRVRSTLSPELLNRIDECLIFNRLQREHMSQITEIGLKEIAERLDYGQGMKLDISDVTKECIAEKGYDIRYGARPLKRVLASDVLNPLSRLVLDGGVREGETVRVRTVGEAQLLKDRDDADLSWVTNGNAEDKNSIAILRNHIEEDFEEEVWDDDEFLMEDGQHYHR